MSRLQETVNIYIKVLHFMGLWTSPSLSKRHSQASILAFVLCLVLPLSLTVIAGFQATRIEDFIILVLYTAAILFELLYAVLFYINRFKVQEFLTILFDILNENDEQAPFINAAFDKVVAYTNVVQVATMLVSFFMTVIMPLFFSILPIEMWKPSILSSDVVFYIHWILQFLCVTYSCFENAINLLILTILHTIIGYGQYLTYRTRMLISTKNFNGHKDLICCVETHLKLRLLCGTWIRTFNSIIFVLYNIFLFIFGAAIFAIAKCGQLSLRESIMFYFYVFITAIFLYVPSYFGQKILTLSENLQYDLFSSDWLEADVKYKKSMIIFMENLKKPVGLKIFIFDYLNLKGFLDTINSGYSMFTVLKNVKNSSK